MPMGGAMLPSLRKRHKRKAADARRPTAIRTPAPLPVHVS
jgi:hypothetical protein